MNGAIVMKEKGIAAFLFGVLLLSGAGCDRANRLDRAPLTDDFAGKTVADSRHAQGLVMTRLANAPAAGQRAPETQLVEAATGKAVLLSEMIQEKPVVLIFGSGSCSALNVTDYHIARLAEHYSEFVDFYFVYLREAHPAGGFNPQLQGSSAEETMTPIEDADSLELRREIALEFAKRASFRFPVLVDGMEDAAAVRWSAWPLRIFVIDRGGTVLYAGDQGPWYFKPVDSYFHELPLRELEREFRQKNHDRRSVESFLKERFESSNAGVELNETDRWAGRPVQSADHVQGMIADRLHNAPKEGEKAPPFTLTDARTGKSRTLEELHRRKPVVLFFGSRSCNATQRSSEDVTQLWKRFGDEVDFYLVYIREAHPLGGDAFASGGEFAAPDPPTMEERRNAAVEFGREKEFEFPILIDRMEDAVAVKWGAWPVRLFLIDESGTVIFAGQQGPWFHKPKRIYDPRLSNVPIEIKDMKGYSRVSLEEVLEKRFGAGS